MAIAVLTYLFIVVRRVSSKRRSGSEHVSDVLVAPSEMFSASKDLTSDMLDAPSAKITAYDEQGRTPVERMFKS